MAGKRILELNTSYFSSLTLETAYWLGFIQADGNISVDLRKSATKTLGIEVHKSDAELLYLLRDCIEAHEHKISELKSTVRLRITSKQLCNDLILLGIEPRKSFTGSFAIVDDAELFRHYLRGVFDGDGCITTRKNRRPRVSIVGGKDFCEWAFAKLKHLGVLSAGGVYKSSTIYSLEFVGYKQVSSFTKFIYKDADLFLTRKRDKFAQIFEDRRELDGFSFCSNRKAG